jgi:tetratricopeptide (TPR) repeat protein
MIKPFVISAFIFLTAAIGLNAQQDIARTHLEKANQLYLSNDFAGARDEYLKIENSGLKSAQLYYNLGNTYYKLGQIPSAILYYERALLLDPRDEDTQFNLNLANQMVVDKINPVKEFFIKSWVKSVASSIRADVWGLMSIIFALILCGITVFLYATRGSRFRRTGISAGFALVILLMFSLLLGSVENRRVHHGKQAIVFAPTATAKSSPDTGGTDLFVIHEGLKVKILEKVGEWVRIRIPDGNEAWLPESAVERI